MKKDSVKLQHLSIPDWSLEDRPREKFVEKGTAALSDAELIAILLRTGSNTEDAVKLSQRLLKSCGNQLYNLSNLSLPQLQEIKGIGVAKAVTIMAAFELGRRVRAEKIKQEQCIVTPMDVCEVMQDKIAQLPHEEFWTIYLNQASKILAIKQIGKGGLTTTIVDVRLIIQDAIVHHATAIIVCHNHPSGALNPSGKDIELTKQIKAAAKIFSIQLVDHIIIHKDDYYSFEENRIL